MSTYSYNNAARNMTLVVPVLLMVGLLIWAVYGLFSEGDLMIYKLTVYTMPVLLASSFFGLHNPSSIVVKDDSITFSGFGRSHMYTWEEAGIIYIKSYGYVGKTLIRLGKPRIFGGRYWITNEMQGYSELLDFLEQRDERRKAK